MNKDATNNNIASKRKIKSKVSLWKTSSIKKDFVSIHEKKKTTKNT